jgi:hypothetical protein
MLVDREKKAAREAKQRVRELEAELAKPAAAASPRCSARLKKKKKITH